MLLARRHVDIEAFEEHLAHVSGQQSERVRTNGEFANRKQGRRSRPVLEAKGQPLARNRHAWEERDVEMLPFETAREIFFERGYHPRTHHARQQRSGDDTGGNHENDNRAKDNEYF